MTALDLNALLGTSIAGMTLAKILYALFTLIVCLIVIKAVLKLTIRLLSRSKLDARVQKYIQTGIKLVLYIIAVVIVAESLDVNMTSLVALLSVGSLGITLAAEDILGNVAGGLVILSAHPFSMGDFIEVNGVSGTVQEISLNHTKLLTPDGLLVLLPNKELSSSKVINYTVLGRRRVTQKVTASYDAPTEDVKAACRDALAYTPKILEDPASAVYLSNYGESSIEYTVFCWCSAADYWDVYFGLGENLRSAFAGHGVEMTYDHLNVHIVENEQHNNTPCCVFSKKRGRFFISSAFFPVIGARIYPPKEGFIPIAAPIISELYSALPNLPAATARCVTLPRSAIWPQLLPEALNRRLHVRTKSSPSTNETPDNHIPPCRSDLQRRYQSQVLL